MTCLPSLALALSILAAPAGGAEEMSRDEERAGDAAEEERQREDAASPHESPVPAVPAAATAPAKDSQPAPAAPGAALGSGSAGGREVAARSLALDVGLAATAMGGLAFPKIPLKGSPDNGWHAPGLGGAFQLHGDFSAMDLDWRVGGRGALPGYMGLYGTVGIRKEMGPWKSPHLVARGAAGLELMLAGAGGATYLLPVFLGEAEASVEFPVIPSTLGLGAGVDLDVRYGLPLGLGFSAGGFVRANLWF